MARYQSWSAPVPAAEAAALAAAFAAGDPREPGWFQYAIERSLDGELIGDLGVHLDADLARAEVGVTVAAQHQGRGYGAESLARVLEHLFAARGLHKVSAECDARNAPSAALLRRLGFREEGLRRQHTWVKGEWTDDLLFGLLADDWAAARR